MHAIDEAVVEVADPQSLGLHHVVHEHERRHPHANAVAGQLAIGVRHDVFDVNEAGPRFGCGGQREEASFDRELDAAE